MKTREEDTAREGRGPVLAAPAIERALGRQIVSQLSDEQCEGYEQEGAKTRLALSLADLLAGD